MSIVTVSGDPLLTRAQVLAFGHNAEGRTETGDLETALLNRHAAAFSVYRKHCHKNRIATGITWFWRETRPALGFMVVRQSAVSATRLRYVQSVVLTLARDYQRENIRSLAIAPLGTPYEWPEIKLVIASWLGKIALPVIVYDDYRPGIQADEGLG